jgi:hypothetical protein
MSPQGDEVDLGLSLSLKYLVASMVIAVCGAKSAGKCRTLANQVIIRCTRQLMTSVLCWVGSPVSLLDQVSGPGNLLRDCI